MPTGQGLCLMDTTFPQSKVSGNGSWLDGWVSGWTGGRVDGWENELEAPRAQWSAMGRPARKWDF